MDFSWSDEQLAFKESVIKFAKNELNNDTSERDRNSLFDKKLWQKMCSIRHPGIGDSGEIRRGRY
jgi:hypothetical protein